MAPWYAWLAGADEALSAWAASQPDARMAWRGCARADWLLWALGTAGADRPALVRSGCDCVRSALFVVPEGEERPQRALAAAEAWAQGAGTVRGCTRAAHAAAILAEVAYADPDTAALSWVASAAESVASTAAGNVDPPVLAALGAANAVAIAADPGFGRSDWLPPDRADLEDLVELVDFEAPIPHAPLADLAARIKRHRWPLTAPAVSSWPARVQVAWDLIADRGTTPRDLSTADVLCARSMLAALGGDRSLCALAERLVLAPDLAPRAIALITSIP